MSNRIYKTTKDYYFNNILPENYYFKQGKVKIFNGTLKVKKGYNFDGCTPKFVIFDVVFGTPDGKPDKTDNLPILFKASLLHDALYRSNGIDIKRSEVDKLFLNEMKKVNFKLRFIYYLFVRFFGILYWK